MLLIGICGGSCSGKSTLVKALCEKLDNTSIIHLDDFFVGKSKINAQEITNWEDPNLYRLDEYVNVINKIKCGETVEIEANSRESRHEGITSRIITPNNYVIVEGFLTFYPSDIAKYFDKKIYMDIPVNEIIRRRYERMAKADSGKYSDEYIKETLINEHKRVVLPQIMSAELIIDATKDTKSIANEVIEYLKK